MDAVIMTDQLDIRERRKEQLPYRHGLMVERGPQRRKGERRIQIPPAGPAYRTCPEDYTNRSERTGTDRRLSPPSDSQVQDYGLCGIPSPKGAWSCKLPLGHEGNHCAVPASPTSEVSTQGRWDDIVGRLRGVASLIESYGHGSADNRATTVEVLHEAVAEIARLRRSEQEGELEKLLAPFLRVAEYLKEDEEDLRRRGLPICDFVCSDLHPSYMKFKLRREDFYALTALIYSPKAKRDDK